MLLIVQHKIFVFLSGFSMRRASVFFQSQIKIRPFLMKDEQDVSRAKIQLEIDDIIESLRIENPNKKANISCGSISISRERFFYLLEIQAKKQFTARVMTSFTCFTRRKTRRNCNFISEGDQVKLHSSTFYFSA